MEFTGERVIPEEMNPRNGLVIEHIARYKFASRFARGRVLDIACGVGYGSEILMAMGEGIDEIVGVDIDEESIEYAKRVYKYPWNSFLVGDVNDEGLCDEIGKFDTIVSMETIEHIKDDYTFVNNLKSLLKEDGLLIISTPFGRGRDFECVNPYHYRQYTEEEFREVLGLFSEIDLYCQCDKTIEKPIKGKDYYLMVALCK
ncbi:SAM-dependent methyltransferase [Orenia metallireducens]|jgi:2-polyprenyl-3-methyl-5-hydroxy-6-metoxy-1,4-benzoquinol methylase|uniref:SAM-dependent methyltransferase n=1 Tax=Orenia metallireducens TaxID=1413210 RepID=A0A1C0AD75_9FIRM|nr:methyltransferase domain-containing protein [Orenia metallireducens]OCL28572.1 SAM-dependent methyltransferase [Orenia metallireducens]